MLVNIVKKLNEEFKINLPNNGSRIKYYFNEEYKFERSPRDFTIIFRGELNYLKENGAGGACFSPEEKGIALCRIMHERARTSTEKPYQYERVSDYEFKIKVSCSEEDFEKELSKIREMIKPSIEIYKTKVT